MIQTVYLRTVDVGSLVSDCGLSSYLTKEVGPSGLGHRSRDRDVYKDGVGLSTVLGDPTSETRTDWTPGPGVGDGSKRVTLSPRRTTPRLPPRVPPSVLPSPSHRPSSVLVGKGCFRRGGPTGERSKGPRDRRVGLPRQLCVTVQNGAVRTEVRETSRKIGRRKKARSVQRNENP